MIKSIVYLFVIVSVIYVGAFDTAVRKNNQVLWEEYQAAVPGCTIPKIEHFSTGCVRTSRLDSAMWNKQPSGRSYDQIKNEYDEINLEIGVCHIGDWYVSDGLAHTAWIYYPCTWRSSWSVFAGT